MEQPAAWHPDPTGRHQHRWWDGQRWTEHVADAGVSSIDQLASPPPTAAEAPTSLGDTSAGTPTGDGGSAADASPSVTAPLSTGGVTTPDEPAAADADVTTPLAGPPPSWSQQPAWNEQPAWGSTPAAGGGTPPPGAPWAGAPAAGAVPPPYQAGGRLPTSGLAIAALVLGLLSIPAGIIVVGGLLGVLAIVFGAIAIPRIRRRQATGMGLSIGGIITGIIGTGIAIVILAIGASIAGDLNECLRETGGDQVECQRRLEDSLLNRFG